MFPLNCHETGLVIIKIRKHKCSLTSHSEASFESHLSQSEVKYSQVAAKKYRILRFVSSSSSHNYLCTFYFSLSGRLAKRFNISAPFSIVEFDVVNSLGHLVEC